MSVHLLTKLHLWLLAGVVHPSHILSTLLPDSPTFSLKTRNAETTPLRALDSAQSHCLLTTECDAAGCLGVQRQFISPLVCLLQLFFEIVCGTASPMYVCGHPTRTTRLELSTIVEHPVYRAYADPSVIYEMPFVQADNSKEHVNTCTAITVIQKGYHPLWKPLASESIVWPRKLD